MFTNRNEAGKLLAQRLKEEAFPGETVVFSIPMGGVVVGGVVAALLNLAHRPIIAKKISSPTNPELALGAISQKKESLFLNQVLVNKLEINQSLLEGAIKKTEKRVKQIKERIKTGKGEVDISGKIAIIIDDGAATGATIKSAIREARLRKAKRIIVALPVAPKEAIMELKREADEVVVLEQPELFFAVGEFYLDFPQVGEEEARNILALSKC